MIRLSTGSTRTDTLFPFTTLLRTSRCRSQLRPEDETHGPSCALRGQSGTIRARTVAGASGQTVPARASCIAPAAMERRTNMALERDQPERVATGNGRESCREKECEYGESSVGAVTLQKKKNDKK